MAEGLRGFTQWPADDFDVGQAVVVWGTLCFVDLDVFGLRKAPARVYVEVMAENWTARATTWLRWCCFCHPLQLALNESARRTALRGKKRSGGRMLITQADLDEAKARGVGPTRAHIVMNEPVLTMLACTVIPGPKRTPLEGHKVLRARPEFKPGPTEPLPPELIARGLKGLAFERRLEDRA